MISDPHKYFLNFLMARITAAASPTKLCLEVSSVDTVDIEMEEIGRICIISSNLSNSHFLPSFSYVSHFIVSI